MKREGKYNRALYVLVAVNILNFYDRNVLGALAEPIRKEFALTDTQIGLLGSAFIWLYAIIGVPLGKLADSWSRRKLLAGGMVVWSALTAVAALATSFTILLFSRLGFAIGEAVVAPAATSWIGDLFPPARRARPLALFMLGVPIGGAASFFFSGPIAQAYGWRLAMVIAALPALVLVPLLLVLPEPVHETAGKFGKPASIGAILKIPTIWWIIASGALLNFNMYAISAFLPAFLSRIHHVSLADRASPPDLCTPPAAWPEDSAPDGSATASSTAARMAASCVRRPSPPSARRWPTLASCSMTSRPP